ncbi:MAG: hypothetical protein IJS76_06520 [Pseudobutyrivibrio sp.]|nr:hypothetical protein [Pseudobutyrivibrio sp.]
MFLEKYAKGFFKRKAVVVIFAILFVAGLLYHSGFLGGEDKRIRVTCVGDSLTYGSGVLKTREIDSYPSKLQTKLGPSYLVSNFGLRNGTASETGNLPYINSGEYADSLKSKPDIVVIMLGTNDTKDINWDVDEYKKGLSDIVASYLDLKTKPKVYLVRSPYCFSVEGQELAEYGIQPAVVADELGKIAQEVAQEYSLEYVDMYQVTEGQNDLYTSDGIHFNKDGYELISDTIYDAIK